MAVYKPHSVKTYSELYAFFKANPQEYEMTKLPNNTIKVETLARSGKPKTVIVIHPIAHEVIPTHYFNNIEVRHPHYNIPPDVIKDIYSHLVDLPKDLFKDYP